MTIQELYDWAKKNGKTDSTIRVRIDDFYGTCIKAIDYIDPEYDCPVLASYEGKLR